MDVLILNRYYYYYYYYYYNGRCYICFSLGLDKVETGYNLLMEQNALSKWLVDHIRTGLLAVSDTI